MDHRPTRQSAPKFKFAADQLSNAELDRYEFIVGSSVDRATIDRASLIAGAWNVMPHDVLLALGWITPEDYVAKLADALGVGHAFSGQRRETDRDVDATTQRPSNVASEVDRSRRFATRVCLTTHLRPEATLSAVQRAQYADTAINSLRLGMPSSSAATRVYFWQFLTVFSGLGLFLGAALVDRWLAYVLLAFLAAVPFAFVVALRLNALLVYWRHRHPRLRKRFYSESRRVPAAELPVYSILVPLFQEADVLRDLLAALLHLDYPSAKLDVILILEESDSETQGAVANTGLPGFVRVVIVPDLQPRTKPKALNYAIQFARGEFVVVYDAEDVPDPDQLREAIQAFTENPEIDCLQARLNIYNPSENWLTAQFALEYTTLFDGLLPSLDRLDLPIPLGGTSNHFRRRMLIAAGLWDPFNVTEDADLGLRLERQAREIAILDSTTWEEAPGDFRNWLRQRTRWIKGWMQTYMVHMRNPLELMQELGLTKYIALQCLVGGFLLSVILHPVFYAVVIAELHKPTPFQPGSSVAAQVLWGLAIFNLLTGFLTSLCFSTLAAVRRGWWRLACLVPLMPVYWLLVSLAAYRAAYQLLTAPYHWEKTRHRPRP